jgi:hypothetical protein
VSLLDLCKKLEMQSAIYMNPAEEKASARLVGIAILFSI